MDVLAIGGGLDKCKFTELLCHLLEENDTK
jgi:hypothetical protein